MIIKQHWQIIRTVCTFIFLAFTLVHIVAQLDEFSLVIKSHCQIGLSNFGEVKLSFFFASANLAQITLFEARKNAL